MNNDKSIKIFLFDVSFVFVFLIDYRPEIKRNNITLKVNDEKRKRLWKKDSFNVFYIYLREKILPVATHAFYKAVSTAG